MSLLNLYFSKWLHPGESRSLNVAGLERSYVVHVPKSRDHAKPMPVVLALHGATMNGPMMAWFTDLNRKADEAGFLAVYPNGTGRRSSLFWNGGDCCGSAMQNNVDDVAFINGVIDDLMKVYSVDARRIYATGMSNGGIMVYRLAAEISDRIAAIAPVAVIEGGGHTWPGKKSPANLLGKSPLNISANDLMWEFFQRHSLA
jgi:polyhydroxybutyrate depolymerase